MDASPTAGDGNKMDLLLDMVREMSKSINSIDERMKMLAKKSIGADSPVVKGWPEKLTAKVIDRSWRVCECCLKGFVKQLPAPKDAYQKTIYHSNLSNKPDVEGELGGVGFQADNIGPFQISTYGGFKYMAILVHRQFSYPYYEKNNNEAGFAAKFIRNALEFFLGHNVVFTEGAMDKRIEISPKRVLLTSFEETSQRSKITHHVSRPK